MKKSNPLRLGNPTIVVDVISKDIARAKCANRAQCVLALAIDRIFGLQGTGYIRVDANSIGVTANGERYRYYPPRAAMKYLQRFDLLGAKLGEDAAREAMQPRAFNFRLQEVRPITAPTTRARKDQINTRRNQRNAERRAAGESLGRQLRYVGV
jgi:hypothetical protein